MARRVITRDGTGSWRGFAARTLPAFPAPSVRRRVGRHGLAALVAMACLCLVVGTLSADPASAASKRTPATDATNQVVVTPTPPAATVGLSDDKMLVEADQSIYDRDANTVTLIGRVQIYYRRNVLQADRVVFFNESKRVVAEGNVRLTEAGGNVIKAKTMNVTKGFQEGFVTALRVDSTDRTRFEADAATRKEGNVTVFENGVYSACQACSVDTRKPPFWQIRAARIVHNQQEKVVYYEDARLELAGVPIAYVPYFQHPDPTIVRQTGFLMPTYSVSTNLGVSVGAPFFWAPTKDWDVTLQPAYLTRQGFLGDIKVRHAFEDGVVSVRAIGINQLAPDAFAGTSGQRVQRGALYTTGQFTINENWKWGWDGTLVSDRRFIPDYHLASNGQQEATSQLYLTGLGERSFFDARAYAFQIFSDDDPTKPNSVGVDLQNKQPLAQTIDYDVVFGQPVIGGEVSARFNLTNVTRQNTDLDITRQTFGIAGDFSRASVDVMWKRQFIDGFGQVITPFASLRGDLFFNNRNNQATQVGVNWASDTTAFRGMPSIGLEYRYPFIAASSFGNHIFEPIAQIIARPSETTIGKLPNEDAQSLVFDDTTLFRTDKFSGFDRAEGGTRANLGLQYTWLMNGGASAMALFGQSYQLAGANSFDPMTIAALTNLVQNGQAIPLTAIGSGLDTRNSDYVARVGIDSGAGLRFGSSARFSEKTFGLVRNDVNVTGLFGPVTASVTWAYLKTPRGLFNLLDAAVPNWRVDDPGLLAPERSELQGSLNLKMSENWRIFGGARYDLKNTFLVSDLAGIGYDNDSFSASLAYSEDTYSALTQSSSMPVVGTRPIVDRVVYFRIGFRTLGDGSISNGTSATSNATTK